MNASKISALAAVAAGLFGVGGAARAADYADVISATPVTSSVAVPRQECTDVEQLVQRQPSGGGALIGAIVGGVVGNQFGSGFGRAAATGIGAVAGSAIGNNVEANNAGTGTVASRRCRTVSSYETRVVGYDVVYDYNGQRYNTRLSQDPGPRLAVDVRPAAGPTPLDRVGPPPRSGSYVPPAGSYVPPANSYVPPARAMDEQATYVEPAPAYSYYEQAPATYYAPPPATVYYGPGYGYGSYVAPAVIGLGLGYWAGRSWHGGYRGGYRGHRGRWR